MNQNSYKIVLHITGRDQPGVTAALCRCVQQHSGAWIEEMGQTVLHGNLSLHVVLGLNSGSDLLRDLFFSFSKSGLRVDLAAYAESEDSQGPQSPLRPARTLCVTLLGALSNGAALVDLSQHLAKQGHNIGDIRTLSEGELKGLELVVELGCAASDADSSFAARAQRLRLELLELASDWSMDLAVQENNLFRRNKALLCLDVDSTLVQMEIIDVLAQMAGTGAKVQAITEAAMDGELDFEQSLRERVACLKGLPYEKALKLCESVPLSPGAAELLSFSKALGIKVGLLSGGFDFFVSALTERFGLDFYLANKLEVDASGFLSGELVGPVVDAERKAQELCSKVKEYGLRIEQSVAVGDGANDVPMLKAASLGIAFHAKARTRQAADLSLSHSGLDAIIALMGYSQADRHLLIVR